MRYCEILIEKSLDIQPWNPEGINPALLTRHEYLRLCNRSGKHHPSHAYDVDIEKLNSYGPKMSEYALLRRFKINGLSFEARTITEKNRYVAHDTNGDDGILRGEDGQPLFYTDDEIKHRGLQPSRITVAIFHDGVRVASAQDEWGTMLIMVAKEYRGFGLGTILGKLARTIEPAKDSGGFTDAGRSNFISVHREFVRDGLKNGLYRSLIMDRKITPDRVREIIDSANIAKRRQKSSLDLGSDDPKDWLLYSDGNGTFVLYDRKLRGVIDNVKYQHFVTTMIKGSVYALPDERRGVTRIKSFGATTDKLRSFMLTLAYTFAKSEGLPLRVEAEEYDFVGFIYGQEDKSAGYSSKEVLSGPVVDYRGMVKAERQFRKSFDRYQEFEHHMLELAHQKW